MSNFTPAWFKKRTGADHFRHGALIAQNCVGVNFYLIAAIGCSGELFTEIGQCNVLCMGLRLVECHPDDGAFLAVFASAAAAGQASDRGCKGCRSRTSLRQRLQGLPHPVL